MQNLETRLKAIAFLCDIATNGVYEELLTKEEKELYEQLGEDIRIKWVLDFGCGLRILECIVEAINAVTQGKTVELSIPFAVYVSTHCSDADVLELFSLKKTNE